MLRFTATSAAEKFLPPPVTAKVAPILDLVDRLAFASDKRAEAQRMSLIAFAIRIMSAAIAFVSQVLLARWMGGFEYGIFVLVWVTSIIVGNLSCLGFHTSVIRYIPQYREGEQMAELRGVLWASRLFVLAASTLLMLLSMALIYFQSGWFDDYYVTPFFLGCLLLPMIALGDVLNGIARAHAWAVTALSPTYIVRPLLILAFVLVTNVMGYEPTAVTAIGAAIVATYLTTIGKLIFVTLRIGTQLQAGPKKIELSTWLLVSLPMFLVEGFYFLLTNADVLMVGIFLPPEKVAVYFAAAKTMALVHFVYFSVKAGAAQRFSAYIHSGQNEELATFAKDTIAWTFWPSVVMAIVILIVGQPVLNLFGPGFDEGYSLLFVLVGGIVLRSSVGPVESVLTMAGHQNICAVAYGLALLVNVTLNFILIPQFGLMGAALATAISMTFEAVLLSSIVYRKLGIVMFLFADRTKGV